MRSAMSTNADTAGMSTNADIGAVYPPVDYPRVDDNIGDELALSAALDPAWDAVLRAWLDGHDRYPHPFRATVRTP